MSKVNTYVTCEPQMVNVFMDTDEELHTSRDAAIEANFSIDLKAAINKLNSLQSPINFEMCLRNFIKVNPDMVRILLGDRDAT